MNTRYTTLARFSTIGIFWGVTLNGCAISQAYPRQEAQQSHLVGQGRAIAELIRKGDAEAIFARFTPEMAKAVPLAALKQVTKGLRTEGPIGERVTEAVTDSNNTAVYVAEYSLKPGQNLQLRVGFASDGRVSGLSARPKKTLPPDPYANYKTKTRLHLPFATGDEWLVFWGGDTQAQNYHVIAPDQRHAFDIVARSANGTTHTGDGKRNEDYTVWGRSIVTPAEATVVEVVNDVPDNVPGVMNPKQVAGNHVVLDFGNGEYALLAHFQQNSVTVKTGDRVKVGQVLGKCGNSGNSSEPHLHFHLQDKPTLFGAARGLPVLFTDYVSNGKPVVSGSPVKGELLRAK